MARATTTRFSSSRTSRGQEPPCCLCTFAAALAFEPSHCHLPCIEYPLDPFVLCNCELGLVR